MLMDVKLKQRYQNLADGKFVPNDTGVKYSEAEWQETLDCMKDILAFGKPTVGVYESISLGPEEYFENLVSYGEKYGEVYGVCDDYTQILRKYPEIEESSDDCYVIFMTPILKNEQPEEDGWRWESWGMYIGTQKPTSDYLYDEKHIDKVFVFSVCRVV